jgi:RimJ/RimL family protein N-acetyltransferase
MEFMLGTMTEEETRQSVEHMKKHFDAHGFGRWAVEIADTEKFIGFVGIGIPSYTLPFSPCVEVAWRICAEEWGKDMRPKPPTKRCETASNGSGYKRSSLSRH